MKKTILIKFSVSFVKYCYKKTLCLYCTVLRTELGTRQFYSFATTTMRQSNRASVTRKIRKMWRYLNGVPTTNINIMQSTIFAWKHGHVVAVVFLRAQLCLKNNLLLYTTLKNTSSLLLNLYNTCTVYSNNLKKN